MLPFCATFAGGGPAGESLLLCWGTMDIPPLELPFVVGREAATPALPGGWPDIGGVKLRSEGSNLNGERRLESIFRHHQVCDREGNVGKTLSEESCMRLSFAELWMPSDQFTAFVADNSSQ